MASFAEQARAAIDKWVENNPVQVYVRQILDQCAKDIVWAALGLRRRWGGGDHEFEIDTNKQGCIAQQLSEATTAAIRDWFNAHLGELPTLHRMDVERIRERYRARLENETGSLVCKLADEEAKRLAVALVKDMLNREPASDKK